MLTYKHRSIPTKQLPAKQTPLGAVGSCKALAVRDARPFGGRRRVSKRAGGAPIVRQGTNEAEARLHRCRLRVGTGCVIV